MSTLGQLLRQKLSTNDWLDLDEDETSFSYNKSINHCNAEEVKKFYQTNIFLKDFLIILGNFTKEKQINHTIYQNNNLQGLTNDYILFVDYVSQGQEISQLKKETNYGRTLSYRKLNGIKEISDILDKFKIYPKGINISSSKLNSFFNFYFEQKTQEKIIKEFPQVFQFEKNITYAYINKIKNNGWSNQLMQSLFLNIEKEDFPHNLMIRDTPFHFSKITALVGGFKIETPKDLVIFESFLSYFPQTLQNLTLKSKLFFEIDKIENQELLLTSDHPVIQNYKSRDLSFLSQNKIIGLQINKDSFVDFLMKTNKFILDKDTKNFLQQPILAINNNQSIKNLLKINKIKISDDFIYIHPESENNIDYDKIISEALKKSAKLVFENIKKYNDREHISEVEKHIQAVVMECFISNKKEFSQNEEKTKKQFKI